MVNLKIEARNESCQNLGKNKATRHNVRDRQEKMTFGALRAEFFMWGRKL